MDEEALTFTASIAPLQSAITIASDGGARFKIDLPESEMPAIVRLMLLRGMTLRFTVEIEQNRTNDRESTKTENNRRAAKRPTDVASG